MFLPYLAVELSLKMSQSSTIRQGTTSIYNSINRGSMMASVFYEIRRLYLLSKY